MFRTYFVIFLTLVHSMKGSTHRVFDSLQPGHGLGSALRGHIRTLQHPGVFAGQRVLVHPDPVPQEAHDQHQEHHFEWWQLPGVEHVKS